MPSDVSGVLFTVNPGTGERSEMIINASFGLGEVVVGTGNITQRVDHRQEIRVDGDTGIVTILSEN